MEKRSPAHSAAYGQACLQCFKSKCRCVARPDGDGCERCHRLQRHCHPSDSLRKRNAQKTQKSGARIAQLEGKIESLVSILQSAAKSPNSFAALGRALEDTDGGHGGDGEMQQGEGQGEGADETRASHPRSSLNATPNRSPVTDAELGAAPAPAPAPAPSYVSTASSSHLKAPSLLSSSSPPPPPEPSAEEAEAYVDLFRSRMLPCLPFFHLPPGITAQKLREDRPFLHRAIVAVIVPSAREKLARGKEFKRVLAQAALLENQSNIDLLLGVLTFVAWSSDQFLNRAGTLSRLMMLAMSLVYDLRLNKPLPPDVHMAGAYTPGFNCLDTGGEKSGQVLLEQQRAVLGCFLLASMISSYFAQIDPMRWTPQMEQGLRAIRANKACPTDETLAFQVRMQLIAQRASQVREQGEPGRDNADSAPISSFLYLRALQTQARELGKSVPQFPQRHDVLVAHMHYVELCINETAHTSNSSAPLVVSPMAGSGGLMPGFERFECLWRSLNAVKAWMDVFFSVPASTLHGFSFFSLAQFARCLVVLYRLSVLEDPAWDLQAVRNVIDLRTVLDRAIEKLNQISHEVGERSSDDLYVQLPGLMRRVRALATSRLAPEEKAKDQSPWAFGGMAAGVGDGIGEQDPLVMIQSMDFGNDKLFEDFFMSMR